MRLRVHDLRCDLDGSPEELLPEVYARLRVPPAAVAAWTVARRAVDARRGRVRLVYALDVALRDDFHGPFPARAKLLEAPSAEPFGRLPECAPGPGEPRPIVIGAGPAGLFASYVLARCGRPPLLLERGRPVERRIKDIGKLLRGRSLDPESNILFGEGGAGTFSDGKLWSNVKSPWIEDILRLFVACGAPERILTDARPHIGTNLLWKMLARLRARLRELGVEPRFETRVDDLVPRADGLEVRAGAQSWHSDRVFLAVGHSARDVFRLLQRRGIPLARKPFQMGVRVEHPRGHIDRLQYGARLGHAALRDEGAEYKLHADGVTTFCMCPGGMIVPAFSEPEGLCLNGMSLSDRRYPFSNSGVVATVWPDDLPGEDPLAGVDLQQRIERAAWSAGGGDGTAPAQRLVDFMAGSGGGELGKTSYRLGVAPVALDSVLPPDWTARLRRGIAAFERKMPGFLAAEALILAPEARCSSPVRIERDRRSRRSPGCRFLFPVGEGAGFAGGIVSAALDGIRSALASLPVPHAVR